DGYARASAASDERRGNVLGRIEGELRVQAGIGSVEQRIVLLAGAIRIVAQRLHAITGFAPGALQLDARLVEQLDAMLADNDAVVVAQRAHHMAAVAQPCATQSLEHLRAILATHL